MASADGFLPANAATSARVNRAQVLRLVQEAETTSRSDLARKTGLTPGTISNVVRDLIALRLLALTGQTAPRRGPNPGSLASLLCLDLSWHRVLAVHQGVSRMLMAVADLRGNIVAQAELRRIPDEEWQSTVQRMAGALLELATDSHLTLERVRGVGVGAIGLVGTRSGIIRDAPQLGWKNVPLQDRLAASLPWPVAVANNVHAMALAEHKLHPAIPEHALYVYVGAGIAAGIIVHGAILTGAYGAAGQLGHVSVGGTARCQCGKVGCLQTTVAEPAIAHRALAVLPGLAAGVPGTIEDTTSGFHGHVVARLVRCALEGEATAAQLIRDIGAELGRALSMATELLDPHSIIIGGTIAGAGDLFLSSLSDALVPNTIVSRGRELEVRQAHFGAAAGLVGAAALALDAFVYNPEAPVLAQLPARGAV